MNDFGVDLKGKTGVLKPRNHYKKNSTVKERTLRVIGGSGCNPMPAWSRNIEVKFANGHIEDFSSYDLEYILGDGGKKIKPIDPDDTDAYVCEAPVPEPAKPASVKSKSVRRKR